ncbi:MAG: hypothetical protein AB7O39_16575 [Flavobacteriaceae bacterium]
MSARNLNIALWTAQVLLALVFGAAGFMKVTMPENGGEKVDHGSGGIVPLRAA